jgi:hypothetical protein
MELHESALIHLLVKIGLKQGADNAFALNSDANMDDDIIPSQAKEVHLLFSKYIKFPDDEYEITFTPDDTDEDLDDED